MKNIFTIIIMLSSITLAQTPDFSAVEIKKSDLEKALMPDDSMSYKKQVQQWQAIKTSGSEIIPLLTEVIHDHANELSFLIRAFALLDEKTSDGDITCRGIVLENLNNLASQNGSLRGVLINLLGKCGKAEDAPLLLTILQEDDDIGIKMLVTATLAKIGDAKTLTAIRKVYAELATDEPKRFTRESNVWVSLLNKVNNTTNATWPKPRKSYLTNVLESISKLEQRVNTQAAAARPANEKKPVSNEIASNSASSHSLGVVRRPMSLLWILGGILLVIGTIVILGMRYKSKRRMDSRSPKQG